MCVCVCGVHIPDAKISLSLTMTNPTYFVCIWCLSSPNTAIEIELLHFSLCSIVLLLLLLFQFQFQFCYVCLFACVYINFICKQFHFICKIYMYLSIRMCLVKCTTESQCTQNTIDIDNDRHLKMIFANLN